MGLPWLLALKLVPWGDVIEHAPKVIAGARRFLDKQRGGADIDAAPVPGGSGTPQERVQALEAAWQRMQTDLAQVAQTNADLAEQNARLIDQVERLRKRSRWLVGGAALLALGLLMLAWRVSGA
ncbi:MAG: hypothetical protein Q7T22_08625 [Serpentinimonas sp.]|nr:MAG: hypothetical protein JM57_05645 [Comamonadaceae bacterium BICA1-1]MDO8275562.1 hypothetical protein [Serpentinimonas sp.]MDO9611069.1 hypothetical protein [Serpentinimonas sp.]